MDRRRRRRRRVVRGEMRDAVYYLRTLASISYRYGPAILITRTRGENTLFDWTNCNDCTQVIRRRSVSIPSGPNRISPAVV